MTSSNVVALPGYSVPSSEAVQEVVDLIEEALEKAKSGKLQGIAIVMVERDPTTFEVAYHSNDNKHTLAAGTMCLHWKISQQMSESE